MAAQIVQITANLRQAILRMRMSGVPATNILFHTNDGSGPCTVTDGTCLFTPEGGGARFPVYGQDVPADAFDPAVYNAAYSINFNEVSEGATGTGLPSNAGLGVGSPKADATIGFVGIRKSVCEAINKILTGSTDIYVIQASDIDTSTMPAYTTLNFDPARKGAVTCVDGSEFASAPPGSLYVYGGMLIEN